MKKILFILMIVLLSFAVMAVEDVNEVQFTNDDDLKDALDEFEDDFDDGLSDAWEIVQGNPIVVNGMLSTDQNTWLMVGDPSWKNYSIESNLMFNLHKQAGFVIRSNGHHRYYAALFSGGNQVSIIFRKNQDENILAKEEFKYEQDHLYNVKFRASENELTLFINGKKILSTRDNSYSCGAAGYRVDAGTMLVENYIIRSC